METKLLYMDSSDLIESGTVERVGSTEDGRVSVILDQTIFYPQGGGQPYDQGTIDGQNAKLTVEETRFIDGEVHHIGAFTGGELEKDMMITQRVNPERRKLNTRVHTAGHLIDVCMDQMGYKLEPGKGYHFPDGPYVEYIGVIPPEERESAKSGMQEFGNLLISENVRLSWKNIPIAELGDYCDHVPENIPTDKPARVVFIADYSGVPCGGTHVKELSQLGKLSITKIKSKAGNTRVSYRVE